MIGSALAVVFIVCACRVDGRELLKVSDDPDNPANPDYQLTVEHATYYPQRYVAKTAKIAANSGEDSRPRAPAESSLKERTSSKSLDSQSVRGAPKAQAYRRTEEVTIRSNDFNDTQFIVIVAGCSTLAAFLIVSSGYCVYRVHQTQRLTQDVDYPAYGITGPAKSAASPPADRKLAQSAQMYHFQHQKQQMIAVEKNTQTVIPSPANRRGSHSEGESDDEDKDYTVYECPGLAPGGQMEVRNPMFNERKSSH